MRPPGKLAPEVRARAGVGWRPAGWRPGKGTRPSRPRPWQAVAVAQTAEGAGEVRETFEGAQETPGTSAPDRSGREPSPSGPAAASRPRPVGGVSAVGSKPYSLLR